MTAGSAAVSRDSPPVFNNLLVYKDEVVPWLKSLADACHEHGAAVMIQLTHLGRRTRWDKADWLPVVSPSHHREAAHRAFPKKLEDWDIERILKDYADAAERMKAAGLDGIELEAYGHLMDQFWSPLTNTSTTPMAVRSIIALRFTFEVLRAIRARVGPDFIVGVRYTGDEVLDGGIDKAEGLEISRRLKDSGLIDFLNVIRGHIDTDAGLTDVIPIQGMASSPHLDFAGEIRAATQFPDFSRGTDSGRRDGAARHRDRQGRHGRHDARAHDRPAHRAEDHGRARGRHQALRRRQLLPRSHLPGRRRLSAFTTPPPAARLTMPHEIAKAGQRKKIVVVGAGPGGPGGRARRRRTRPRGRRLRGGRAEPGGQVRLTARARGARK